MRIAIYYPWVYLTSGVERTILELYRRSRHQYTIFTNTYDADGTFPEFRGVDIRRLTKVPVGRNLGSVLKAASVISTQKLNLEGFDALLIHCEGLGDLALIRTLKIPTFCFCHTPLRPVFDPDYRLRVMRDYSGPDRLAFNLFSSIFAAVDRFLWSRYRYVFFNSEETRVRAEQGGLLGSLRGKYEVLHPGIDWHACSPTWIYEKFFLVAGRIMWTKNVELAVEAFIQFKDRNPRHAEFRLVIAGHVDEKSKPYLLRIQQKVAGRNDVRIVISPSDIALQELLASCYGLLFPPFNEDWGIVPLEANAFGKPVIASDRGGPRESQIDSETGYLVPPSAHEFARAMSTLADSEELVRNMGKVAREHSAQYDWTGFVERADLVMENIVLNRSFEKKKRTAENSDIGYPSSPLSSSRT